MSSIAAFFADLGAWNWFIIAVVLLGLEVMAPGAHFLWFGLAAVITGFLGLITGFTWQWQLIAFALLSIVTVMWGRRAMGPQVEGPGDSSLTNRAEQYVGRTFEVAEPIQSGRGKVKVGDTLWLAEGQDTPAGAHVRVTGARGTVLTVERDRA